MKNALLENQVRVSGLARFSRGRAVRLDACDFLEAAPAPGCAVPGYPVRVHRNVIRPRVRGCTDALLHVFILDQFASANKRVFNFSLLPRIVSLYHQCIIAGQNPVRPFCLTLYPLPAVAEVVHYILLVLTAGLLVCSIDADQDERARRRAELRASGHPAAVGVVVERLCVFAAGSVFRLLWATVPAVGHTLSAGVPVTACPPLAVAGMLAALVYGGRLSAGSLGAFAGGVVVWHIAARAVPLYGMVSPALCMGAAAAGVACLCAAVACRYGCAVRQAKRGALVAHLEPSPAKPSSEVAALAAVEVRASTPLTQREREVLARVLAGETSAQAARALGISSSTVRNHLGHIYRKVDVANLEELNASIPEWTAGTRGRTCSGGETSAPQSLPDGDVPVSQSSLEGAALASRPSPGSDAPAPQLSPGSDAPALRFSLPLRMLHDAAVVISDVLTVAGMVYAGATLFPFSFTAGWGFGAPVVLASAGAALLAAVVGASLLGRRVGERAARQEVLAPCAALLMVSACAAQAFLFPSEEWELAMMVCTPADLLLVFLCTVCFATGFAVHLVESTRAWTRDGSCARGAVCIVAFLGLSVLGGSEVETLRIVAAYAVMCAGIAAVLVRGARWAMRRRARCDQAPRYERLAAGACAHPTDGQLGARDVAHGAAHSVDGGTSQVGVRARAVAPVALLTGAVVGFSFEEFWRSAATCSLDVPVVIPLSVVSCALCVLFAGTHPARERVHMAGLMMLIAFCSGRTLTEDMMLAAMTACSVVFCGCAEGQVGLGNLVGLSSGFCCGALAGNIGVNAWGDAVTEAIRAYSFEGSLPFQFAGMGLAGALLVCMLMVLLRVVWHALAAQVRRGAAAPDSAHAEQRLMAYLSYRGLSHTQAAVMLGIMRGQSSAMLAQQLCVSRGTVNSARATGYAILGVHSKEELTALLSSLVQA